MSQTSVMAGPSNPGSMAGDAAPATSTGRWTLLARTYWVWPALLTALVVRYQIARPPLWRDEFATWSAARRPWGELFDLVGHIDAAAAPYYLMMHVWIGVFGESPMSLRMPSLIFMAGAAAVTTLLARRLFGTLAGVTAGVLFAAVPMVSRYGQEARPYAAATLFAVLATWLLVRALDRPTWGRWTGYALAVVGVGLFHILSLLVVAGHTAAVLLAWRRDGERTALRWVPAIAAAGAVLAGPVLFAQTQQSHQLDWVGTPAIADLLTWPGGTLMSTAVAGALFVLGTVGAFVAGRWAAVLAGTVIASSLLLFVGGLITHLWVLRYLNFTVPLVCVAAAAGIARISLTGVRRVALVTTLVLLIATIGLQDQDDLRASHDGGPGGPDYRKPTNVVVANQQPGDGIVYGKRNGWWFLDIGFDYFAPDSKTPRDALLKEDAEDLGTFWASQCDAPEICLTGIKRLWVFTRSYQPEDDLDPPTTLALNRGYTLERTWHTGGFTVALYLPNKV